MKLIVFIISSILSFMPFYALADGSAVRTTPLDGTVSLTFDDGPSPIYTPQILAILKKYNIKATFFMVGVNAKKYPDIVKMVLADGHAIDSHSLTHPMLTKLNNTELNKEVETPQIIIFDIIGKKPVCLRYPFGASNSHVRDVIRAQGMEPVPMGWNSFDYERPGVDKIVAQVLNYTHSGQVILLHDGYDKREQTVAALPKIIEGVKKKGLGFSQICIN
jgi:peptidoglycan/xylan/chitin deacetylase (PgdA/CDA1 family)